MWWDNFTAWLDKFSQNPTVVAIFSVVSTFAGVFLLFTKSSYGRRAINSAIQIGHRTENIAKETLEKVEAHKQETEEKIIALKNEYEQKIAVTLSLVNYYEVTFFEILSLIPNAKVQAKISELKENYDEKKKVIEEQVGLIYEDFELAVNERVETIEQQYAEKYNAIYSELENLKLQIAPFQKSVDEILENTEPVEEEVYEQENENTDSEKKGI